MRAPEAPPETSANFQARQRPCLCGRRNLKDESIRSALGNGQQWHAMVRSGAKHAKHTTITVTTVTPTHNPQSATSVTEASKPFRSPNSANRCLVGDCCSNSCMTLGPCNRKEAHRGLVELCGTSGFCSRSCRLTHGDQCRTIRSLHRPRRTHPKIWDPSPEEDVDALVRRAEGGELSYPWRGSRDEGNFRKAI